MKKGRKRTQYPDKNYLIKKALEQYPEHTTFQLVGFREFNKKNSVKKKIFALEKRIQDWSIDLSRPKVIIFCYLLKSTGNPLRLEKEVTDYLANKYSNITFLCESEVI